MQTGNDFRLLWMAFASFLGAAVATATLKTSSTRALATIVFIVTTLIAGFTAILLGATAGPGAWMVAVVYGIFWAASSAFNTRARTRQPEVNT